MVLAVQYGDKYACEVMGISMRTLQRHRARVPKDAELADELDGHKSAYVAQTVNWANAASEFLYAALAEMREKLQDAELRDLAAALKIVGELAIAREVLADEYSASGEGASAQGAEIQNPGGQSGQESPSSYN